MERAVRGHREKAERTPGFALGKTHESSVQPTSASIILRKTQWFTATACKGSQSTECGPYLSF